MYGMVAITPVIATASSERAGAVAAQHHVGRRHVPGALPPPSTAAA